MLQLVDKADDHTDKNLHTAQGERPQHYHDDIIDGREKRLPEPGEGAFRVNDFEHLRDKISEKAAGQCTHKESRDAA